MPHNGLKHYFPRETNKKRIQDLGASQDNGIRNLNDDVDDDSDNVNIIVTMCQAS